MNNEINFKELWQNRQPVQQTDLKGLRQKANAYKRRELAWLIITNVLLIATCIFIMVVAYKNNPQFITTKIGLALIILAIILYLLAYDRNIMVLGKRNYAPDNNQFLKELLELKRKQAFLYNTMVNIYYVLLTIGLGLTMIEYIQPMNDWSRILAYTVTFCWILFAWLYIKPKTMRRHNEELNGLISKLKEIRDQF